MYGRFKNIWYIKGAEKWMEKLGSEEWRSNKPWKFSQWNFPFDCCINFIHSESVQYGNRKSIWQPEVTEVAAAVRGVNAQLKRDQWTARPRRAASNWRGDYFTFTTFTKEQTQGWSVDSSPAAFCTNRPINFVTALSLICLLHRKLVHCYFG